MTRRPDREWTIVQIQYRDPCPVSPDHPSGWTSRCERYVVDAPLKSMAMDLVEHWLDAEPSRRESLHEVHYYPRTYVDMERDLRARGRIIT